MLSRWLSAPLAVCPSRGHGGTRGGGVGDRGRAPARPARWGGYRGLCPAAGCSPLGSRSPSLAQCLDGIDYDDFNFGTHMMEQKEPLMQTGKGRVPPGSPAVQRGFPAG